MNYLSKLLKINSYRRKRRRSHMTLWNNLINKEMWWSSTWRVMPNAGRSIHFDLLLQHHISNLMKRVACILYFLLYFFALNMLERDHRRQEMLQEIFYKHNDVVEYGKMRKVLLDTCSKSDILYINCKQQKWNIINWNIFALLHSHSPIAFAPCHFFLLVSDALAVVVWNFFLFIREE